MRRLRPFEIFGRLITPRLERADGSGGLLPQSAYADDSAYAGFSAKERHDKRHRHNSLGIGLAIAGRRRVPVREPDAEPQAEEMTTGSGRRPAYGEQMSRYFRLAHAPSLVILLASQPH